MKKTLGIITILALATGIATHVAAKPERKDQPKNRFVVETLKAIGGEHSPEKMDVKRITSIEIGDTYYHIYEGELDKIGYHVIVFDNYQNYLGYYKAAHPPTNYEIEGCIVLDPGEVDGNGNSLYYQIPIDEKKGLPKKLQIGGTPTSFVKSPTSEPAEKETTTGETTGGTTTKATTDEGEDEDEEIKPEFRTWTITFKGKPIEARAIYLKQEKGKVYLRLEATSQENGFLLRALSKEDQEYVKQFK